VSAGGRAEILRVAERALLVRFPHDGLAEAVVRAHALAARMVGERLSEKGETVLGAGSVLIRLPRDSAAPDFETLFRRVRDLLEQPPPPLPGEAEELFVAAVEFGGEAGADLAAVAAECGLDEREVVERLCAAELTVAFIGFSPGFPYLVGLPRELEVARLATPRERVPAGSVAIAGPFAGVYPSATPGGWRLLGRTAEALFDPASDPPATLAPGDRVRFEAI